MTYYLKKSGWMCLLLVFIVSCASMYSEDVPLYLDKSSGNGSVYYVRIPVLSPERKREEQYLFRTASQIAMRNKIFVQYITEGETVASVLTEYDQRDTLGASQDLVVLSERFSGNWYEALIEDKGKRRFESVKISINQKKGKDGNPSWVAKPPKSGKYETAVSCVSSPIDHAEGFFLADEWAIAALSVRRSEPIESGAFKKYEAVLTGAYIAARWYNESKDSYYSLAVLPN